MTGRVEGKMAFVTGAAQGIGEAIAFRVLPRILDHWRRSLGASDALR